MTVVLKIKNEEIGKKVISELVGRYVESVKHVPPILVKGAEVIIYSSGVEQSIVDFIVDATMKTGARFFDVFEVSGYVSVGNWLDGKEVPAKEYIRECCEK